MADMTCPYCDEDLIVVAHSPSLTVVACPDGCYERPINRDDPEEADAEAEASERYWMARWTAV